MKPLPWLNYHHLQYFRTIVREGGVIKAARKLKLSQSTISAQLKPKIQAQIDDMALLRLLALTGAGLALVPEIGVKFELEEKRLLRIEKVKNLKERFYAITAQRSRLPGQIIEIIEIIENGKRVLAAAAEQGREKRAKSEKANAPPKLK